jgi:16S rRNA C967 or C1407 C5-methylase (RsmB/RsmF family)
MHRSLPRSTSCGPFPSGMLIASEFDAKRAKLLLAGRVRHLTTPNCLIGIAAAQSLPEVVFGEQFDRVLADVPCSGDGTIRKDPRLVCSWLDV